MPRGIAMVTSGILSYSLRTVFQSDGNASDVRSLAHHAFEWSARGAFPLSAGFAKGPSFVTRRTLCSP